MPLNLYITDMPLRLSWCFLTFFSGDALGPLFFNATSTPIQGRSFSEALDEDEDGYDAEGVLSAISTSNRLTNQLLIYSLSF